MTRGIINSDRFFQVWSYSVSHRELILRSTKSTDLATRIDVFFKGVDEVHLPMASNGLLIEEISEATLGEFRGLRQTPFGKDVKIFVIRGADFVGYVAALIALSHEDDGEYHEPSFLQRILAIQKCV